MSYLLTVFSMLSSALAPIAGAAATALAVVVFTLLIRLALHPLSRAGFRGETARNTLAPRLTALREKHRDDPRRMVAETQAVYREHGVRPTAGCLPMLLQLPVFFVTYRLFTSAEIGGAPNPLLNDGLFGTSLGAHWFDVLAADGLFGGKALVFWALFAAIGAVATWTVRRARRSPVAAPGSDAPGAAAIGKYLPLLSYGTIIAAAVVPLAAGLYLVTSMTWTAAERAVLRRGVPAPAPDTEQVHQGR